MEEKKIFIEPSPVWVQIDLNARSRDGYARARLSRASGPIVAGDEHVIVYEPDDCVAAPARVVHVDPERGLAYLDVRWDAMDDAPAYGWMPSANVTYAPDAESNAATDVSMRLGFVERLCARFVAVVEDHVPMSGTAAAPVSVEGLAAP